MCVHQLGLDRPFHEQYFRYLGGLLQGDLGRSYLQKTEVATLIWSRLPATALLVAGAIFFEIAIGMTMGLLASLRRGSRLDQGLMVASFVFASTPQFVMGILLLYIFAVHLDWFPMGGYGTLGASGPAGADPRRPRRRLVLAADALQHDRRAAPGFHPHRQGQGSARRDRGRRPCVAECDPADRRA